MKKYWFIFLLILVAIPLNVNALKLNTLSDTIGAIQELFSGTDVFTNIILAKQSEWETIINKFILKIFCPLVAFLETSGYLCPWISNQTRAEATY